MYMYLSLSLYIYIYIYIYMYTCAIRRLPPPRLSSPRRLRRSALNNIYIYIYTYTYVYIYIYIHTHNNSQNTNTSTSTSTSTGTGTSTRTSTSCLVGPVGRVSYGFSWVPCFFSTLYHNLSGNSRDVHQNFIGISPSTSTSTNLSSFVLLSLLLHLGQDPVRSPRRSSGADSRSFWY